MDQTRISFLHHLADGKPDAWEELDHVYRPLILHWLRRYNVQPSDADDLAQEVMTVVLRQIGEFEHNGRVGAFRNWLRTTAANLTRNYFRKRNIPRATGSSTFMEMLEQLEDPNSGASREFDKAHDRFVVNRLLTRIAVDFEAETLKIFQFYVIEGHEARQTAEELGVSIATVHTAKSRVLRRLRQMAADLIDEMYLF